MAKRRAKKQGEERAKRRATPAPGDEARLPRAAPHDEAPAEPKAERARPRPLFLVAAIGAVLAIAATAYLTSGDRTQGQDIEEIVLDATPAPPELLRANVVRRYPHDTEAFTQGLLWHEGHLYESTGLRGRSSLRKVALESGEVLERRDVDRAHFAEGLALVRDRLVQLTWRNGVAHEWSLEGLRHRRTFQYEGEGWGLCYDGRHLVMSDGTARLTFRDPSTFRQVRQVTVRNEGRAVGDLNELECVDGAVWANVWQRDEILRIDPASGRVTAVVDASGLLTDEEAMDTDVLNGIAWIPERERFVITGKLWPHLFEIELVPRARP